MASKEELEELDNWTPMADDYNSIWFNSYNRGPGAQMIDQLTQKLVQGLSVEPNLKLLIDKVPLDLTETGLTTYLNNIGCPPKRTRIIEFDGGRKAKALVDFANTREATKALECINGQPPFNFKVSFAPSEKAYNEKKKALEDDFNKRIQMAGRDGRGDSSSPSSSVSSLNGNLSLDLSQTDCDKLIKVLPTAAADCSFCLKPKDQIVDHVHFAQDERRIVEPVKLPPLVDFEPLKCNYCQNREHLKKCSACGHAYYCGRKCQLADWKTHLNNCTKSSTASNDQRETIQINNQANFLDRELLNKQNCTQVFKQSVVKQFEVKQPVVKQFEVTQPVVKQFEVTQPVVKQPVVETKLQPKDLINLLPKSSFILGKILNDVLVVYQDPNSLETFWVASDGVRLQEIMQECASFSQQVDKKLAKPKVGQVYLVKGSDNEWYRGLVLDLDQDMMNIYYLDFGNTEMMEVADIFELPHHLEPAQKLPVAVKCQVKVSQCNWDDVKSKIAGAAEGSYLISIIPLEFLKEDCIYFVRIRMD